MLSVTCASRLQGFIKLAELLRRSSASLTEFVSDDRASWVAVILSLRAVTSEEASDASWSRVLPENGRGSCLR